MKAAEEIELGRRMHRSAAAFERWLYRESAGHKFLDWWWDTGFLWALLAGELAILFFWK